MNTTINCPAQALREVEFDSRRVHGLRKLLALAELLRLESEVDSLRSDLDEFARELASTSESARTQGYSRDEVADAVLNGQLEMDCRVDGTL